jgi:hypothetical protein
VASRPRQFAGALEISWPLRFQTPALAFSLDEEFLCVGTWEDTRKVVNRSPVNPDATLGRGKVFADTTGAPASVDIFSGLGRESQRGAAPFV